MSNIITKEIIQQVLDFKEEIDKRDFIILDENNNYRDVTLLNFFKRITVNYHLIKEEWDKFISILKENEDKCANRLFDDFISF